MPNHSTSPESPTAVADGVFLLRSSCNVYAIVRDGAALLIDSGEADVIDQLTELGVDQVEWVLHTHAHRDQCAATPELARRGAQVAVSAEGEPFYKDPTGFWNDFNLYIRYQFTPDTFKPARPIPVHKILADGESLTWRGIDFTTLATPGHSLDHTTWLADVGGRKLAFTGDMIHSPGKVWNLFHFDYKYWDGGFTGVTKTLTGLSQILAQKVDLLLPSHGEPMDDPAGAVALLRDHLDDLYDLPEEDEAETQPARRQGERREPPVIKQVTEHLYHVRPTGFVLLDGKGGALFYDHYSVPNEDSRWAHARIDTILKELKIERVEVVIPSHYHEDHVRGFPTLKDLGAEFWVYEDFVDILEHPSRYNFCCLAPEITVADRVIHDNEWITWGPYTFQVTHFPGQTEYHMAMVGEVDGRRVMFMGDTDCFTPGDPNMSRRKVKLHGISSFFNEYNLDPGRGFEKAMQRLVELEPELMLFSHSGPREGSPEAYRTNLETIRTRRALVEKVLPHEDPNIGFDPNQFSFYPYTAPLDADGAVEAEVRLRNHLYRPMTARIEIRAPEGWRSEPSVVDLEVAGKWTSAAEFRLVAPKGGRSKDRTIITARIIADGTDWGEYCEMIVEGS